MSGGIFNLTWFQERFNVHFLRSLGFSRKPLSMVKVMLILSQNKSIR